MSYVPNTILNLYEKVQDLLDRSKRSWLAAYEAWNEEPPSEIATPATTQEVLVRKKGTAKGKKKEPKINSFCRQLGPLTSVSIKPPGLAVIRAQSVTGVTSDGSQLIIWADASKKKTSTGFAVAFLTGSYWVRVSEKGHTTPLEVAELEAVCLALDYAVQVTEMQEENSDPLRSVEVFTDSQSALRLLRTNRPMFTTGPHGNAQGDNPYTKNGMRKRTAEKVSVMIDELSEAGVMVELHWVPRGRVVGNVIADKGAAMARMGWTSSHSTDVLVEFLPVDEEQLDSERGMTL
ncbi:nadph2 dehydrogenase [Fusarium pseudocircinatum]|uniref:Nadph2 dehydrogenase n=1 Tax=Fusarium pseudocircinatum TaxID=56676 RepID=A0A8H5UQJ6_9HYPO|nr:nadph2 dehydrogenase [Fusarium pseudocircinatum]